MGLEGTPATPTRSSHPCSGARSLPEPQQLEPPVFFLRPPLSGTLYSIFAILFFRLFVERRPATVYPLLFVRALLIGSFPILPISPIHHPSHYLSIYIYRLPSPCVPSKIVSFVLFCICPWSQGHLCVCARIERTNSNHIPPLAVCLLSYWSFSPLALPLHPHLYCASSL